MAKKKTDPEIENEELEEDDDTEVDDESQDETDDDDQDSEDDDEETDDEDEDGDDDEDDDSDEDEDDDEDDADFKKRFTQFKGETPEEYLKNLEEGYAESSKEAVRLSREVKAAKESIDRVNALIASNPDLAKALKEGEGQPAPDATQQPANPAISWAETQMKQTWTKEFNEFAEKHPEIETDLQLAEQVDEQLAILRDVFWQREKRQLGMGEGLELAWKILGKDSNDDKEKLRMAAKASASQGKATGGKKSKGTKTKFSEAQITVAMDMMNVDRNTAIKQLSQYVK